MDRTIPRCSRCSAQSTCRCDAAASQSLCPRVRWHLEFDAPIAHRHGDAIVNDALREIKSPHNPKSAVDEFASLLKSYNVENVTGDRYAGEWPREAFRKRGVGYELSELPKSGLYVNLLPRLNSQTIRLIDNQRTREPTVQSGASHSARWQGLNRSSTERARRRRQRYRRCRASECDAAAHVECAA